MKSWSSRPLPRYHPQVAAATARIFEIPECESPGRLCPAGLTKDTVAPRGRVGLGGFRLIGFSTASCFLFQPGGDGDVDLGQIWQGAEVQAPARSGNSIKMVIEC